MTPACIFAVVANGPHARVAWEALALPLGVTVTGFKYEDEFLEPGLPTGADLRGRAVLISLVLVRNTSARKDDPSWVRGYPIRWAEVVDHGPVLGWTVALGPTVALGDAKPLTRPSDRLERALRRSGSDARLQGRDLHPRHPYLAAQCPASTLPVSSPPRAMWAKETDATDAERWRSAIRVLQSDLPKQAGEAGLPGADQIPPPIAALRVAGVETAHKGGWVAATVPLEGPERRIELRRRREHRLLVLSRWGSAQTNLPGLTYGISRMGPIAEVPAGVVEATPGGVSRRVLLRTSDKRGSGQVQFDLEEAGGGRAQQLQLEAQVVGRRPRGWTLILIGALVLAGGLGFDLWVGQADDPRFVFTCLGILLPALGVPILTLGLAWATEAD